MDNFNNLSNFDDVDSKKRKKKRKHKNRLISGEKIDKNTELTPLDKIINNINEFQLNIDKKSIILVNGGGDNNIINNKSEKTEILKSELNLSINKHFLDPNESHNANNNTFGGVCRSKSVPQHISIGKSSDNLLNTDLTIDCNSQVSDSALSVQSARRMYQTPTLTSPHATFSMRITHNECNNVEESKLQTELKNELIKYFPEKKAKIMIITWNMAGISTYPELLLDLIGNSNIEEMCDIYLICFQETTSNKQDLLLRLQATFGGHYLIYNYIDNGSLLCVLVGHKNFIWNLALIGKSSLSTRVTPITKGAVAISFQFFGNTILFLGSHFSSGVDFTGDKGKNSLRIEDYNTILYSKELIKSLTTPNMQLGPDEKNLSHYFDYTFWAGDLNFRILRDDVTVARLILTELEEKDGALFEELLIYDELINNQTAGLVFQEFEEARILFLPTYRYTIQTNDYNEKRTPSYTDRILFKSFKSRRIECLHYNAVQTYNYSDHKPVCALMEVIIDHQNSEHLKSSGVFQKDIYTKCFDDCETRQRGLNSPPRTRICSIQ